MRFEGREIRARAGESVAAALLAAGIEICRDHPKTGLPRAPFCLMGTCFECLVTIDGQPNRQACLVPAADGLIIERGTGGALP
ncbi:MAG: (2Fe-2S)-binding protein [Pseudomonadota bacterium]